MQKIVPHLWFDKEAVKAAEFYTSIFPNSKITTINTLHDTPSGDADTVSLSLFGQDFLFISAGPYFKVNPSVSFAISCKSAAEVEALWGKLIEGGTALMELGEYPFSEKYGWVQDKYGVSWQVMFRSGDATRQKITPTMMFVGDVVGKTEEAVKFYASVFPNSEVGFMMPYEKGEEPDKEGTIKYASFTLEGQEFAAMDSARMHDFGFTEAISFLVNCKDQEEIDYLWEKLSAVPQAEQCGWLKDKFGFSWQIAPAVLNEMMQSKDEEKVARVTQAFLKMKKFNIAELEKAFAG